MANEAPQSAPLTPLTATLQDILSARLLVLINNQDGNPTDEAIRAIAELDPDNPPVKPQSPLELARAEISRLIEALELRDWWIEQRDRRIELLEADFNQLRLQFPCSGCTTEPEETCPRHGRPYSEWVELTGEATRELEALRESLRLLADPPETEPTGPGIPPEDPWADAFNPDGTPKLTPPTPDPF